MTLYYNNAASDGDWGNVNNWWQDDAFTIQASAIPTSSDDVEIYGNATQNTAAYEWYFNNANVYDSQVDNNYYQLIGGGVINFYGTSTWSGWCIGNMSFHDNTSIVGGTSLIQGNVTMRDSSRGGDVVIEGNVVVYYDDGGGEYPFNSNGQPISGTTIYKNWEGIWFYVGFGDWETLANWNNSSDGSGDSPAHIPWTSDGNGGAWYGDNLLTHSSYSGDGVWINTTIDSSVTGTCNITYITNNGTISGGTWIKTLNDGLQTDITNNGTISGGDFYGAVYNYGVITGGNFNLSNSTNYEAGIINGGSSYNVVFTGYGTENLGYIYGLLFSGTGFTNSQNGQLINCYFTTGSGFTFFSVYSCLFNSDGTFERNGHHYTYNNEWIAITYPPSGGGGGGIDIARLLGLPFFVKL